MKYGLRICEIKTRVVYLQVYENWPGHGEQRVFLPSNNLQKASKTRSILPGLKMRFWLQLWSPFGNPSKASPIFRLFRQTKCWTMILKDHVLDHLRLGTKISFRLQLENRQQRHAKCGKLSRSFLQPTSSRFCGIWNPNFSSVKSSPTKLRPLHSVLQDTSHCALPM